MPSPGSPACMPVTSVPSRAGSSAGAGHRSRRSPSSSEAGRATTRRSWGSSDRASRTGPSSGTSSPRPRPRRPTRWRGPRRAGVGSSSPTATTPATSSTSVSPESGSAPRGSTRAQVVVTDDVASAPVAERASRRGIAGDVVVFKVLSAAAEQGLDLDEVERLGRLANDRTVTLGVAYSGCTFPGADAPLFTVPEGQMGLGLGHPRRARPRGRPLPHLGRAGAAPSWAACWRSGPPARATGWRSSSTVSARRSTRSCSSSGTTSPRSSTPPASTVVAPEVGELVTSLDMGGVSLTLCWLDDELEPLWLAPADSPAFRRGSFAHLDAGAEAEDAADLGPVVPDLAPEGDDESRRTAEVIVDALRSVTSAMRDAERLLGDLDAVAGDGDHGRGMVRGAEHAFAAAAGAAARGWGAAGVLVAAGDAWGEHAGGTSGVLWGAGLRAMGGAVGNHGSARPGGRPGRRRRLPRRRDGPRARPRPGTRRSSMPCCRSETGWPTPSTRASRSPPPGARPPTRPPRRRRPRPTCRRARGAPGRWPTARSAARTRAPSPSRGASRRWARFWSAAGRADQAGPLRGPAPRHTDPGRGPPSPPVENPVGPPPRIAR